MKFSLFCLMSLLMVDVCSAGRTWQGRYLKSLMLIGKLFDTSGTGKVKYFYLY